jgi:hypothetical protein
MEAHTEAPREQHREAHRPRKAQREAPTEGPKEEPTEEPKEEPREAPTEEHKEEPRSGKQTGQSLQRSQPASPAQQSAPCSTTGESTKACRHRSEEEHRLSSQISPAALCRDGQLFQLLAPHLQGETCTPTPSHQPMLWGLLCSLTRSCSLSCSPLFTPVHCTFMQFLCPRCGIWVPNTRKHGTKCIDCHNQQHRHPPSPPTPLPPLGTARISSSRSQERGTTSAPHAIMSAVTRPPLLPQPLLSALPLLLPCSSPAQLAAWTS